MRRVREPRFEEPAVRNLGRRSHQSRALTLEDVATALDLEEGLEYLWNLTHEGAKKNDNGV